MAQIFQVLKCYKCAIFQVHQTKKDNKWKCKVCGEKQSIKRHYGIGTAKDCRIHVQKLNNLRGDIEETKFKGIDSEDNDYESNTENNTQAFSDNSKEESKWLAYVDKEEISVVKEPENIHNLEVCLKLPQKRKINRKRKPFKDPKLSSVCNKKTEINNKIIKKLPIRNSDTFNTSKHTDSTVLDYESSVTYQTKSNNKKKVAINKSINFQTSGSSKWAQYVADDDTESDDQYEFKDDYKNHMELYNDDKSENSNSNYYEEGEYYQQHNIMNDGKNRSMCKETEVDHKTDTCKPLFSLCDDNDLDNILDF